MYYDGVDSMGRPVVIVNAAALPRSASRKAAVGYLLQRLEPIVTQVSPRSESGCHVHRITSALSCLVGSAARMHVIPMKPDAMT